jgi:hypothetical protein
VDLNRKMSIDYENIVKNLKQSMPDIKSVVIIDNSDNIIYTTDDWDINNEIKKIIDIWDSLHGKSITIGETKFSILQTTPERLVATSIQKEGHIVGAKDDEHRIIAYAESDGNILTAYTATARALKSISSKEPYINSKTKSEKAKRKAKFPADWDTPKLREEMMKGLIEFFTKGGKLEKPDEIDIKRREKDRKLRMEELKRVLQALEITKEEKNKLVSIKIETHFITDYIYDDFQLLKIKHQIEKLIEKEFQVHDIDTRITKKI